LAVNEGEYEEKISCVAAPVKDHSGETIAALSVSILNWRKPPQEELIQEIVQSARELSKQLGYLGD